MSRKLEYGTLYAMSMHSDNPHGIIATNHMSLGPIATNHMSHVDGFGNRFLNGFSSILGGEMKASWN